MNVSHQTYSLSAQCHLHILQGDLTRFTVDAIVNAANSSLQHGGGVAVAISIAGGPVIQAESDAWVRQHGPITPQTPAYTQAGQLPCRYVIHAVGPIWGEGDEDHKLADAISGSLRLADQLQLHSLALPAISTGIYGFPKSRAARIFMQAILAYFTQTPFSSLRDVSIILRDSADLSVFLQAAEEMFSE